MRIFRYDSIENDSISTTMNLNDREMEWLQNKIWYWHRDPEQTIMDVTEEYNDLKSHVRDMSLMKRPMYLTNLFFYLISHNDRITE